MVRYALILIFLSFVNLFLANTPNLKKRVNLSETNESEEADKYYLHKEIKATVFWIGEEESEENDYISNRESIWDKAWLENYGGVDDPKNRNGFYPAAFIPKQNPFYVALPYSDIVDSKKVDSVSEIPWYAEEVNENVSQVKNRWLKVIHGGNVCYAQWEDAGPGVYDDFDVSPPFVDENPNLLED